MFTSWTSPSGEGWYFFPICKHCFNNIHGEYGINLGVNFKTLNCGGPFSKQGLKSHNWYRYWSVVYDIENQ